MHVRLRAARCALPVGTHITPSSRHDTAAMRYLRAGMSLSRLQGPATDSIWVMRLVRAVHLHAVCKIPVLISHDRQGRPFSHSITAYPLVTPGGRAALARIVSQPMALFGSRDGSARAPDSAAAGGRSVDSTLASLCGDAAIFDPLEAADDADALAAESNLFLHGLPRGGPELPLPLPDDLLCVVTRAEPPYGILWASSPWLHLCGFVAAEVLGLDLQCIQGPSTSRPLINRLMHHVRARQSCTTNGLVNYDKERNPFCHSLHVDYLPPVAWGSQQAVFRATSTHVTRPGSSRASYATPMATPCEDSDGESSQAEEDSSDPGQIWGCEFEGYSDMMEQFGQRCVRPQSVSPGIGDGSYGMSEQHCMWHH